MNLSGGTPRGQSVAPPAALITIITTMERPEGETEIVDVAVGSPVRITTIQVLIVRLPVSQIGEAGARKRTKTRALLSR